MTLHFNTVGGLSIILNQPNLDTTPDFYRFKLQSQYSKANLVSQLVTVFEANDRYSAFNIDITQSMIDGHFNGMYWYTLTIEGGAVVEKGVAKVITNPGGETNFTEYTSADDNREADVYFRPNY